MRMHMLLYGVRLLSSPAAVVELVVVQAPAPFWQVCASPRQGWEGDDLADMLLRLAFGLPSSLGVILRGRSGAPPVGVPPRLLADLSRA